MADSPRRPLPGWLLPGGAGVAAALFGAGLGELSAALFAQGGSPFTVIGSWLVDLAPPWAKDTAIALFGTNDKTALLVGIGIVLIAVAFGAGVLEWRRPPFGRVVLVGLGVVGFIAATSRANATPLDWVPSAIAAGAAASALAVVLRRLPAPAPERADAPEDAARATGIDRRRFLGWAGGAAAIGAVAALGGYALQAGSRAVSAVREAISLPTPATPAPPIPAGAELGINGLAPVVTPNDRFYRIDTALRVPDLEPADWSLRIHGMVDREITLTWDELLALPLVEHAVTLACVSNEVGGSLIGNAVWLGAPIRELLAEAGPAADADMVLSRSVDGWTASTPIEALTDDRQSLLAVGMNGEPLPAEHGFPVRMVVPGLYGYVSATKWVTELEVTRFDRAEAYWTPRGWSERGPIKLHSRIDVPRPGSTVSPGAQVAAGVAWHQHTGVAGVEVSVDDGPWEPAELATAISDDTWVQWRHEWQAEPGTRQLRVRAISADGEVQTEERVPVAPDGATGHHGISVNVA
ncbi:molybdopterin-dependent oxidoreductase [Agromyces mangrovi Wang et al. 2018]|uniref:molybdopterin-dependent oxidoreductase n=1 Tax=Agromyces mangrovi TaxID=1858653 RepID=UPI0025732510|nr:molybdopterin-dependent oxidoreductase [Agromyces mangrovi]BDZ64174.1 oxidoreductase [Agromyces mangrovi]